MASPSKWRDFLFSLSASLLLVTLVQARISFKKCGADFVKNQTSIDRYAWHGRIYGEELSGRPDRSHVISKEGCLALCGGGSDWYEWQTIAATITTWILPLAGLLAQAPFESNAAKRTFLALVRWVGSPIASLSSTLWNVRTSGKLALMVEMSIPYGSFPDEHSAYSEIRDSFYILNIMNQYTLDQRMDKVAGERLLRVVLFSNDLKLPGRMKSLAQLRREVAASLREGRRRGIVPVYVSLLWFISSLAISIVNAFANIGKNTTAHDLALGLLLSWIPVLILTSIVDRNPVTADDTKRRLNDLVEAVREALLDEHNQQTIIYLGGGWTKDYGWLQDIQAATFAPYFREFAGQGRVRMQTGVANPILSALELSYVGQHGRDWLCNEFEARRYLAYGPVDHKALSNFDFRQCWQILSSILIVHGSIAGPFIISYLTPTVGLGCRSGGYLIFLIMTGFLLILELAFWWTTAGMGRARQLARWLFPVLETMSALWLMFIVWAQTIGLFKSCMCVASSWDGKGKYIDFTTETVYTAHVVKYYWMAGTLIPTALMLAGFAFIIAEWCEQSHLNTENYSNALKGLKTTRRWKRHTAWFRHIPDKLTEMVTWAVRRKGRRSLVWTKDPVPIMISQVQFKGLV
ncbi:MAG: hypothetical protein M1816_001655 [Peltula sp. TS41687]|nr:MAG: hypothetical protein M1816_001655 [Peltula sp. TS41687]